jgi:S-adenosylmethionine hydrolase
MIKRTLQKILVIFLALSVSSCAAFLRQSRPQPLIILLTDFGEKDHYVGAMKGSIYSADPSARVDSITNQITKFDIEEGAYTLAQAAKEYPDGTIFVGVVDPGVGSSRKGIAIKSKNGKIFIGPDNGLLSVAAEEAGIAEVRELTNKALMHPGEISNTFHGRDVFGPVAGHLAAGVPFEDVGPVIARIVKLPAPKAAVEDGRLVGQVIHVDDYGNILTDIPIPLVEELGLHPGSWAKIRIGAKEIRAQFVRTYSDVEAGTPLFLNNKGLVETAIDKGNLARMTGATQGVTVVIEP